MASTSRVVEMNSPDVVVPAEVDDGEPETLLNQGRLSWPCPDPAGVKLGAGGAFEALDVAETAIFVDDVDRADDEAPGASADGLAVLAVPSSMAQLSSTVVADPAAEETRLSPF